MWFQQVQFFIVCACEVDFVKGENKVVQNDLTSIWNYYKKNSKKKKKSSNLPNIAI
jgi:hypothetical protein